MFKVKFKKRQTVNIKIGLLLMGVALSVFSILFLLKGSAPKKAPFDLNTAQKYITGEVQRCNLLPQVNFCYKTIASEFLKLYSLPQILEVFKNNEQDSEFLTSCHQISHYLGQDEYQRLKNVRLVFSESSADICLAGTFHGAVEGYFMQKGITNYEESISKIKQEIPKICGAQSSYKNLEEYGNCNHGMGHALMNLTQNDLPQSLKLCDYLQKEDARQACYSGTLMENITDANSKDHPSKYSKIDDPIYPCNILEGKYQKQCYGYGVLLWSQLDPVKSISTCSKVPSEYTFDCFKTFGSDRVIVLSSESEVKNQCNLVENNIYKTYCFKGASYHFVTRYGLNSTTGDKFCSLLDSSFQNACYQSLGEGARAMIKNSKDLEKYCDKISNNQYKNSCLTS